MPFSTYIHGVRFDRPVKDLAPIVKRLARLASSPQADLADLVGTEVRVTLPNGTERLYAVLAQDPKTGVLHLKDIDGGDRVIN